MKLLTASKEKPAFPYMNGNTGLNDVYKNWIRFLSFLKLLLFQALKLQEDN